MELANPKMVGDLNKTAILNFIKENGPISRADIARQLKLSAPAVSKNINALLEAGLIKEIGTHNSDMGRKPIIIEFNKNFRFVIGVDIGEKTIRGALANLSGEIIDKLELPSYADQGGEKVFSQITSLLTEIIGRNKADKDRISAIAIGSPGLKDLKTGRIILATFIEAWDEIKLKSRIEEAFGIHTIVENDVDMDIIGERWQGAGREYKNILYIKLGDGLASRMILNGEIYRGLNLAAGEIGYMVLGEEFVQDGFRPRGALEELICNNAVRRDYIRACKGNRRDMPSFGKSITISDLIEKMVEGDEVARSIMQKLLRYFSMALINVISVLDVEVIILGGDISKLDEKSVNGIAEFLKKHVPFVPPILGARLGKMSGAMGGIKVALSKAEQDIQCLW